MRILATLAVAVLIAACDAGPVATATPGVHGDPGGALLLQVRGADGAVATAAELESVDVIITRRLGNAGASVNVEAGTDPGTLRVVWLGPVSQADAAGLASVTGSVTFHGLPAGESPPAAGEPPTSPVLFAAADVDSARVEQGANGQVGLFLELKSVAAHLLAEFTQGSVGGYIVVALDRVTVLAPAVQAPISDGKLQLVGADEAVLRRLAAFVVSGPLPADIEVSVVPAQ